MVISEIAINDAREIESIKLKINDRLVDYLRKEEYLLRGLLLHLC